MISAITVTAIDVCCFSFLSLSSFHNSTKDPPFGIHAHLFIVIDHSPFTVPEDKTRQNAA